MTNIDKKLRKRWGKKFVDKRDWKKYNEQLVKRGEYFINLDFVEGWDEELKLMNSDKIGAPYRFPKTLIELQALWRAKRTPVRMIEGITRELFKIGKLPEYNDYSTVSRRVNKLDFRLAPPRGENITVYSDGSGWQAINSGEYLREKYGKKNRRWVQIIILGDAETHEPVSYEVNIVPASEPESTERQISDLLTQGAIISIAGGDGAMDDKELWTFLDDNNIKPVIKPDINARDDTDCPIRNHEVKLRNALGYKKWARFRGYGERWVATEGIFSAVKRIFGEQLLATSEQGLIKEAECKIWAYQRLKRSGES